MSLEDSAVACSLVTRNIPASYADRVRVLVDEDPPLTPSELDQLAVILGLVRRPAAAA